MTQVRMFQSGVSVQQLLLSVTQYFRSEMKSNEASYILSYFFSKGSFRFVNNKGIEIQKSNLRIIYSFCLENGVMMILKRRLLTLIFACLCYKKSFLIKNKGISYKIDSCIIHTVKDHGIMLSFDHFFDHNTGEVSRSEISVDRPNERELRVCEQTEVFLLFSPA